MCLSSPRRGRGRAGAVACKTRTEGRRGRSCEGARRVRRDERRRRGRAAGLSRALRAGSRRAEPTCSTIAGARRSSSSAASGITFAVYGEARRAGTADPLRHHAAHPDSAPSGTGSARGLEQRVQAHQRLHRGHLRQARDPARRRGAGGSGLPQSGVPAGDERPARAARPLRAHRRHRRRAHRRRRLLRARGQCPHAVRRLLHAGEPRDHAAAVSGAVLAPSRGAGRELSGRAARDAELGRAADRVGRADGRAADARRLQLRLLRALVPRRQARRRAGRGPRPVRATTASSTCARPRARSAST